MAKQDKYRLVRIRLGVYAQMKSPCAIIYHPPDSNINFVPSGLFLAAEQHDILLGILKKVEAKSAVVAAVIVFCLSALVISSEDCPADVNRAFRYGNELLASACGCLIAMLVASLDNAAHLGQPKFRHLKQRPLALGAGCDEQILGRELQVALVRDMLKKEAMFSTFYVIVPVIILLLLGSAASQAACGVADSDRSIHSFIIIR